MEAGAILNDLINDLAGGTRDGQPWKAALLGGAAGTFVPYSFADLSMCYERLKERGATLGSGAVIVMGSERKFIPMIQSILRFFKHESCGKCVPCRVGVRRMREILDDIVAGKGEESDIDYLQSMAETIKDGALCGLGKTAPNPVLATLRYFRSEYEAHIREKRCPAGVCKDLISYSVDQKKCTGCGACLRACPQGAVTGTKKKPHRINVEKCIKCGACFEVCVFDAIVT